MLTVCLWIYGGQGVILGFKLIKIVSIHSLLQKKLFTNKKNFFLLRTERQLKNRTKHCFSNVNLILFINGLIKFMISYLFFYIEKSLKNNFFGYKKNFLSMKKLLRNITLKTQY